MISTAATAATTDTTSTTVITATGTTPTPHSTVSALAALMTRSVQAAMDGSFKGLASSLEGSIQAAIQPRVGTTPTTASGPVAGMSAPPQPPLPTIPPPPAMQPGAAVQPGVPPGCYGTIQPAGPAAPTLPGAMMAGPTAPTLPGTTQNVPAATTGMQTWQPATGTGMPPAGMLGTHRVTMPSPSAIASVPLFSTAGTPPGTNAGADPGFQ
jgi:hypothetical protein